MAPTTRTAPRPTARMTTAPLAALLLVLLAVVQVLQLSCSADAAPSLPRLQRQGSTSSPASPASAQKAEAEADADEDEEEAAPSATPDADGSPSFGGCPQTCKPRAAQGGCPAGCVRRWCSSNLFRCEPPVCAFSTFTNGSYVAATCKCTNPAPPNAMQMFSASMFYAGRGSVQCIKDCVWGRVQANCTATNKDGWMQNKQIENLMATAQTDCCAMCGDWYAADSSTCW